MCPAGIPKGKTGNQELLKRWEEPGTFENPVKDKYCEIDLASVLTKHLYSLESFISVYN